MSARRSTASPRACSGAISAAVPTTIPWVTPAFVVSASRVIRRSHLGKTEIEDLDATARSDEDVRRLDVAMDDAGGMRGVQRVGNLDPCAEPRIYTERAGGEPILQRRTLQVLHDDERKPVLLADVMDGADVGWFSAEAARASRASRLNAQDRGRARRRRT